MFIFILMSVGVTGSNCHQPHGVVVKHGVIVSCTIRFWLDADVSRIIPTKPLNDMLYFGSP